MIARNREEGSKSAYIGAACYPTLAMFNHSCDPSIIRFYIEGGFQLLDLIRTELKSHMTC